MGVPLPSSFDVATFLLRAGALCAQVWLLIEVRRVLRRRGVRRSWLGAALIMVPAFVLVLTGDLFGLDGWLFGDGGPPSLWLLCAAAWTVGGGGLFALVMLARGWGALRRGFARPAPPPASAGATITRRTVLAAPFAVSGYGVFIERERFMLSEVDMVVPNLPPDLEGLRIGQITDIHAGPFLEPKQVRRIVDMVNEARPHLGVITGDVITRMGDPLHEALDALGGLRADSGLWGCLGNHEQYARCRGETKIYGRKNGIEFLRQERQILQFGSARLNLVGVDYQRTAAPYLTGAGQWIEPGAVNLLLSHNPDVFPVAADLGYDLVLSGHTHGGQITLEILEQTANPGRFLTPYVSGIYKIGGSSIYVCRGVGTVTIPMRIGARPEATIIRLRRA